MGEITRQIALQVLGSAFKGGADYRNSASDVTGYRLIVKPKLNRFSYAYNQLKNFSFAVTPQVNLELNVKW